MRVGCAFASVKFGQSYSNTRNVTFPMQPISYKLISLPVFKIPRRFFQEAARKLFFDSTDASNACL